MCGAHVHVRCTEMLFDFVDKCTLVVGVNAVDDRRISSGHVSSRSIWPATSTPFAFSAAVGQHIGLPCRFTASGGLRDHHHVVSITENARRCCREGFLHEPA